MRLPSPLPSAVAVAAALLSMAAHAADKRIPIDAFVEQEQYSQPRLSPDGKHLAVNVRLQRNGRSVPTMTIYALPEKQVVATIALPGYEIPLDFQWLTNRRLVVEKGLEVATREQPEATGEIVAVNVDGSKPEYLYGYQGYKQSSRGAQNGDDHGWADIAYLPRTRDGSVFLGTHQWGGHERSMLNKINSNNAQRTLVADLPMRDLNFLLKNDGTPLFAYGADEHALPLLLRRDDSSGQWRQVDKAQLGTGFRPYGFSADDKQLYATHSTGGGPFALIREDVAGGGRTVLASDPFGSIAILEESAFPEVPFAGALSVGIPKARYIDANSADAKLHQTLSASFPDAYVHFINFSDDGQTLLFRVSSDRDPGSYYLFDRKSGKAELLFSNMQQIDPDQMAERRPVRFKARDGVELAGYLTLPANPDKKKLPMILLPHGGPFGINDHWFFDTDAQFLASRGYAVLQVNFRGSGGRGPQFETSGYREWGGKILDDLVDGVKWANALPDIDANRVCVYGASFGGYAALMLPVRAPALFKCAVGYAGVYDLPLLYKAENIDHQARSTNFLARTLGDDTAALQRDSPVLLAERITLPVLLVHGGKDKTAEVDQADNMRAALIKAGRPPEWMKVAGEGHGFYDSGNRKAFYEKLEAFLDKHIGH